MYYKMIPRRSGKWQLHVLLQLIMSVVTATTTNSNVVDETSSSTLFITLLDKEEGFLSKNRMSSTSSKNVAQRNDQQHTNITRGNIIGSFETAQNVVFQVSDNTRPPVKMEKSVSFEDYMTMNNGKEYEYDFISFQDDATGESLNIMSVMGGDDEGGIPRFVG